MIQDYSHILLSALKHLEVADQKNLWRAINQKVQQG